MATRFSRIRIKSFGHDNFILSESAPHLAKIIEELHICYFSGQLVLPKGEAIEKMYARDRWFAVLTTRGRVLTNVRNLGFRVINWKSYELRELIKEFGFMSEAQLQELDDLCLKHEEYMDSVDDAADLYSVLDRRGFAPSPEQLIFIENFTSLYDAREWCARQRVTLGMEIKAPKKKAAVKDKAG